jgi:cbb3-type cytochrome oxidase subunit 1
MATHYSTVQPQAAAISRLPGLCFKLSSLTAVIGVSLGVYMGIASDHTLGPVHVHLNLIGWVSLFLFGLFYKFHPEALGGAAVVQVSMVTVGYIVMLVGLAGLLLTSSGAFMPLAVVGSLLVWAGFLLFLILVARTA